MSADQWFGAAIIAGAIVTVVVFRRESRLRREASPVVPLDDLLHEQDSAEAYDDLPEADAAEEDDGYTPCPCSIDSGHGYGSSTEADDINGDGSLVISAGAMDEIRARKVWAEHWNARLKLDFDGGAR